MTTQSICQKCGKKEISLKLFRLEYNYYVHYKEIGNFVKLKEEIRSITVCQNCYMLLTKNNTGDKK